jgi:uncharacterized protein YcaQ
VRTVIDRVGLLQLDPVAVLCRSHYLPVFARIGAYPMRLLDEMSGTGDRPAAGQRALFEYWGHKASLLPLSTHPLHRWRMHAASEHVWGGDLRQWRTWLSPSLRNMPWAVIEGMTRLADQHPGYVDDVLAVVAERGPVNAAHIGLAAERRLQFGGLWNWNDCKVALEWLFCMGKVSVSRTPNFERLYDLTERVLPADVLHLPTPTPDDAQRELIRTAARAHGIATERELRNYFLLPAEQARIRINELVAAAELIPIKVTGRPDQLYLWSAAQVPSTVNARALLSPFDPLIQDRNRTFRVFDFHYRISLYTPAAKRTHGYYVLPYLHGERLAARVDLRADRGRSALLVPAAHTEPDQAPREIAGDLADELRAMARWLELEQVNVAANGNLGPALAAAVGRPLRRTPMPRRPGQ